MDDPTKGFDRLRPAEVDEAQRVRFLELVGEIEEQALQVDSWYTEAEAAAQQARLAKLLAEWNAEAHRAYEAYEFKQYHGGMDTETFVREALLQPVGFVDDLRFEEACAAIAAVSSAKLGQAETGSIINALNNNFPGGLCSDLVFWPDVWFGDKTLLQIELTPEQMIGYLCKRSGRKLADMPDDLELSVPVPAN
ncbi:MAG TPA: hypothetical protein ENK57_16395 [Polyangiaceae bacterium]|nr:hypothetical protein [Polyangiaceae bacterium]